MIKVLSEGDEKFVNKNTNKSSLMIGYSFMVFRGWGILQINIKTIKNIIKNTHVIRCGFSCFMKKNYVVKYNTPSQSKTNEKLCSLFLTISCNGHSNPLFFIFVFVEKYKSMAQTCLLFIV